MERRAYFEAVKLHKYFPGVHALNDVTITADKGSVLGIIGINGAGKSTFMNALAGELAIDSGEYYIGGKKIEIRNQKDSEKKQNCTDTSGGGGIQGSYGGGECFYL